MDADKNKRFHLVKGIVETNASTTQPSTRKLNGAQSEND